jgi:hypothetical protein
LKKQTGVRIDAQVWEAYKDVCRREKLRPSEPIEEYLRLILEDGSAITVSRTMRGMLKVRSESFDDYARVLINWYTNGKRFVKSAYDTEFSIATMLLQVLKDIADPLLRKEIVRAISMKPSEQATNSGRGEELALKEEPATMKELSVVSEGIGMSGGKDFMDQNLDTDQTQKTLKAIRELREKLKSKNTSEK